MKMKLAPRYHIYKNLSESFFLHLKHLGYKPMSSASLHRCTQEFLYRLEQQELYDLTLLTGEDILAHHDYLQHRPHRHKKGHTLSEMMIWHHLYAVRVFFNYLEQTELIEENPVSSLQFYQPRHDRRKILDQGEIKRLYAACETLRERAMLHLFYGCGLRRSEGMKLNVSDVSFRSKVIYVREGKGGKNRAVPMSEKISEELKAYLYQKRKSRYGEQSFITNGWGERMKYNSVGNLFKVLLKRSGIEKAVCLHSLRHSIATHLLESGVRIEQVRDFLGHRHLESTQIYAHVSKAQLQEL